MDPRASGQAAIETATKQAVAAGMDTPLSDSILDGVEQGRGIPVKESRRAPMAVLFLAFSFVLGYYLGRRSMDR